MASISFSHKGLRPSSLFSTTNQRINAPTFSGRSSYGLPEGYNKLVVADNKLLHVAGRWPCETFADAHVVQQRA